MNISVIIPAYNEADRLPGFLQSVIDVCKTSSHRYSIIVVDDGSRDNTSTAALSFKTQHNDLSVITLSKNMGKGYAVKRGMMASHGDVAVFLDADGSTRLEEIERHLHFLDEGFDIVIGSRVLKGPEYDIVTTRHRKFMGTIFNFFVRSLLLNEIRDPQCGFKMFKKKAILPIFSRVYINRFGFDIEALYLARLLGFRLKETPVSWRHYKGSKVNLLTDSLAMFLNILQVKFWHWLPINSREKYFSDTEFSSMAEVEKKHWWFVSKRKFLRQIVRRFIPHTDVILDAGCGPGHHIAILKEFGKCFGCDIAPEAFNYCPPEERKKVFACHLENLSVQKNRFDLITALDVIEHTENPEKALDEMKRALKENGKILITVPAFRFLWGPHDEALCHLRRYNKKDLRNLLELSELRIEVIGYLFFTSFLLAATLRLFRRIFPAPKTFVSDTNTIPVTFVNKIFSWACERESRWIGIFPLPFGTTLFAVCSKKPSK